MKQHYTFFTVLIALFMVFAVTTASAQTTVTGGAAFGTEGDLGLKVGAHMPVSGDIHGAADITLFFPSNYDLLEVNVNALYPIPMNSLNVSAIGGLNYSKISVESVTFLGQKVGGGSASDIGLNVGGMIEFGDGPLGFYVDAKFVLGGSEQLVIGGGVALDL